MRFIKKHWILSILLCILSIYIYVTYTRPVELNNASNKNFKFYVNDLYSSNGRIYNNFLNDDEKKVYELLFRDITNREPTRKFNISEFNCKDYSECFAHLSKMVDVYETEFPEILNFSSLSWKTRDKQNIEINYIYATGFGILDDLAEIRIKRTIYDIQKATKDMTDGEKILYVYNYMGSNFTYDRVFTYTSKNQSLYNVFINKNAVCAGFAKATQVIFQNIGIESYGVTGMSTDYHMWNIIKYNGKYYFFDPTVAVSIKDKNNNYYYKGLDQTYLNNYSLEHPEWYPTVEKTSYVSFDGNHVNFLEK